MTKAILVGININQPDDIFKTLLEESKNLCKALDIDIVETLVQKSRSLDKKTGLRKGKLLEIRDYIIENDIETIIFHNDLNLGMTYRINEILNVNIIDRTSLILNIFSKNAKSKESKLQVNIARLKYSLPAAYLESEEAGHQRGNQLNRGTGETKSEKIKRDVRRQITLMQREITRLQKSQKEKSKLRKSSDIKALALVGYTNVGKSSLLNYLVSSSDKKVSERDALFETLDISARRVVHKSKTIIVYDTVGFVSNLPHDLIESFYSTLSIVKEVDLLVHLIDSSNPNYLDQKEVTDSTLKKIGAHDIRRLEVYSKKDMALEEFDRMISTKTKEGIESLLDEIIDILYPLNHELKIVLLYKDLYLLDKFKNHIECISIENDNEKSIIKLKSDDYAYKSLRLYEEENL